MTRLSITIKLLLWIWLLFAVSGCRTAQSVEKSSTAYQVIMKHDSVWVRETDTVRVFVMGDTVRIFEKQTFFKEYYTIYRDTLRTSDTLRVEKIVQLAAAESPKPVKRWRWFMFGAYVCLIIIFAVRILKAIYLRK